MNKSPKTFSNKPIASLKTKPVEKKFPSSLRGFFGESKFAKGSRTFKSSKPIRSSSKSILKSSLKVLKPSDKTNLEFRVTEPINEVLQKKSQNDSKEGTRIAKVIADAGFCSRRQAEELIKQSRVQVNGKFIDSPATIITDQSIKIDGKLLGSKQKLRIFLFHKPAGFICTNSDPENRPTIFSLLPKKLPRLIAVGRLDFNSEGLLLLTTSGEAARYIELPKSAWIRKYRVRAFGKLNRERLSALAKGIRIGNIFYGPIFVKIEVEKESNSWLEVSLSEGKNREIRKIMAELGLTVNRLIRIGFGPFNLAKLPVGEVFEVKKTAIESSLPSQFL